MFETKRLQGLITSIIIIIIIIKIIYFDLNIYIYNINYPKLKLFGFFFTNKQINFHFNKLINVETYRIDVQSKHKELVFIQICGGYRDLLLEI